MRQVPDAMRLGRRVSFRSTGSGGRPGPSDGSGLVYRHTMRAARPRPMWNGEGRDSAYDVMGARRAEGERPLDPSSALHQYTRLQLSAKASGLFRPNSIVASLGANRVRQAQGGSSKKNHRRAVEPHPNRPYQEPVSLSPLETERPAVEISFGVADNTTTS